MCANFRRLTTHGEAAGSWKAAGGRLGGWIGYVTTVEVTLIRRESGSDPKGSAGHPRCRQPPGPCVLWLPAGNLEGEAEANRRLDPPVYAAADQLRRGLHGAHARPPYRPFTRIDQDAPGEAGGCFDVGGYLVHGISPPWVSRTP
ncbi:hypothetical protein THIOKS13110001 [Thiocapsa sp. KS1]|nr:hypothetical protein THIOKS13110001 [Thiocapsa sp. KS1]